MIKDIGLYHFSLRCLKGMDIIRDHLIALEANAKAFTPVMDCDEENFSQAKDHAIGKVLGFRASSSLLNAQ